MAAASLRLGHGDRIGLIGPNGSGKTTLLKVIAGEQEIDDGKVTRANGVRIGWLPQDLSIAGGRSPALTSPWALALALASLRRQPCRRKLTAYLSRGQCGGALLPALAGVRPE